QAIVPGKTAANADLDLHRGKIQLVIEYGEISRRQLVEPQRFADRAAALVHEGRGLEQQDLFGADPPLLQPALELLLDGPEVVDLGDGIHRHEADVVPVQGILPARIAETDPELHVHPSQRKTGARKSRPKKNRTASLRPGFACVNRA